MEAQELFDELRFQAEKMAKGTAAERSAAYSTARKLLDQIDQLESKEGGDPVIAADRLKAVRELLASLATVGGSQAWELDQYWNWARTAIESLADAVGLGPD